LAAYEFVGKIQAAEDIFQVSIDPSYMASKDFPDKSYAFCPKGLFLNDLVSAEHFGETHHILGDLYDEVTL
jgi:hypothetical protein